MHLARTVTHSTVEECMQRMTAQEFAYWQVLYKIEPWGNEWRQTEAIAAASLAPWSKAAGRMLPKLFPKPQRKRQSAEDVEQQLNQWLQRRNRSQQRGRNRRSENHPER